MRCGKQEEQRRIVVPGQAAHLAIVDGVVDSLDIGARNSRAHVDSSLRRFERAVAVRCEIPFVQGR